MDGNEQVPPYPPSPQNNGGGYDNVGNNDIDRPLHSPQNNADRLEEDQHNYSHKRNNDGKHSEHNSSRRGRKERRRKKRNRHHSNNNDDIPLNYDLHHQMQRNHPERYQLYVNLMNQQERHYNNDRTNLTWMNQQQHYNREMRDYNYSNDIREMRDYNINRDHKRKRKDSSRRRDDQSSSRRRSRDNRRKKNRSRSRSDTSGRFDQRRKRNSSRHAMKRYSRSYSRDRSNSSISTRRRDRRRDDSSRRRDRGRHRHYDSSSSSRERSHERDRRHRRRREDDHRPNRRNNNIEEGGQNNNNREEGNEGIRIVVSEDSDNHLAVVGGRADTTAAVAVDQMERPSRRDSEEADLGEDRSVESDRKKSASGKKSRHRHRSRRSSSSRSGYSSRSTRRPLSPQGNETNYLRGDSSFKRRSYSHSPPFRSKVANSKKKKKKSRRRRDRSSSISLIRSRSRNRRRPNYSRSSSSNPQHRSLSPRMYSSRHDHQREHFSRSRSFSSSRRDYKKQNKRRHKKNKKKDKKKKHESHNSGSSRDDTVGHFRGGPGTVIDNRYRIIRDVGLGTFGRVVQCENIRPNHRQSSSSWYDQQDNLNTTVAIKVVRNIQRYHESAIIEADICERINMEQSRQKKDLCATLLDRFSLSSGHYCLAFECLGKSLYDFLKVHKYRPFPMFCVRDFAQQLLETLEFLHGFGLIHTDLKLENILLSNNEETTYRCWDGSSQRIPVSTKIKVIDFGGATYDDEKKSSIVNTRQYRAPEVILGWGWSFPSDLWSAGCIIAELYMGELLFGTHDNEEHLALIERAVGPFSKELLQQSTSPLAKECFDSHGWHKIRGVLSSRSIEHVRKMVPVEQMISEYDRPSGLGRLLRSLLDIDPKRRITAREALMSPFFTQRR